LEIKSRFYPYPVLSHFSDDYVNSNFDVEVSATIDNYGVKIDFSANVNNLELSNLLSYEQIAFVYHLECSQTGYREAISTFLNETLHFVSDKKINGKLQICPFIIAKEEIKGYVNSCFNEDYKGFRFDLEQGCIMAVGKQVDINVENEINDFSNTPSVFSIVKNDNESDTAMVVDFHYKKIVIKLPEKDFYNFKSLRGRAIVQSVLNALVITPALAYVLEEVSKRNAQEKYEYSSYSWYRAIKKALSNKFGCDIEQDGFTEKNMLELSQKLINSPLTEALDTLSSGYLGDYEEDDE